LNAEYGEKREAEGDEEDDALPSDDQEQSAHGEEQVQSGLDDSQSMSDQEAPERPQAARFDMSSLNLDKILESKFGYLDFLPGQKEVIERVLQHQSTLAVLPTGGGKSLCYQLPAYVMSQQQDGITLVITPTLSLMEDQISSLPRCLKGATLNSNQTVFKLANSLTLEGHASEKSHGRFTRSKDPSTIHFSRTAI
jgi:superfamily II DNA helicase RecQ